MARRGSPARVNALIGVDKPQGMTSHDVVARVRRAVGERRVGHAGTLDPLATGVMVIGIGQATRLLGLLTLDTKRYLARIRFGFETSTDDAEGEPTRRAPADRALSEPEAAKRVLAGFIGTGTQVPPAFSAISVNGVRSYRRARAGEEVELAARPIEVFESELVGIDSDGGDPVWTVAFTVSKGAYIRSLARDIGRAAGSAAHVAALRRTASGGIALSSCLALDEIDADTVRDRALDPVAALGLTALEVGEEALADLMCGRAIAAPSRAAARVALTHGGRLVALAHPDGARLAPDLVFPQAIEGVLL